MPQQITRRRFVRDSSLIAMSASAPAFLCQTVHAAKKGDDDGRILVVIQLDGGNDGINTVVPYRDQGYEKNRKVLRLPENSLLRINEEVGLHPSMRGIAELIEDGRLGIVQGVGYPNPNRSHEASMAIWQTGNLSGNDDTSLGWIGTLTDNARLPDDGSPHSILMGTENVPSALRGRRSTSLAMANLQDLERRGTSNLQPDVGSDRDDLRSYVARTTLDAYKASDLIRHTGLSGNSAPYPSFQLAHRLKMIAQLIKSGFQTPVYYAIHGGFDTHYLQLDDHQRLLYQLSAAMKSFLDDLKSAGLDDRVLVMAFSEFGRRVKENASQGTDHGTAGPVFLAGTSVKLGLIGETPRLTNLTDGDLQSTIDFRDIYGAIQRHWLGIAAPKSSNNQERLKSTIEVFR